MSRHDDVNLDDLFRAGRAARSPHRWRDQRRLFRGLGLGSPVTLLLSRLAQAFPSVSRQTVLASAGVVLLASIGAATVYSVGDRSTSSAPAPSPRAEVAVIERGVATAPATESPVPPSRPSIATTSVDALPSAPARGRHTSPAKAPVPAPAPAQNDDLARELASVAKIRADLAAHDYAGARDAVRLHRASFPHGVLAQEATLLEIEASRGLGDDTTTCSLGRAFLDAHPMSAHRGRVLGLMRDCATSPSAGAP